MRNFSLKAKLARAHTRTIALLPAVPYEFLAAAYTFFTNPASKPEISPLLSITFFGVFVRIRSHPFFKFRIRLTWLNNVQCILLGRKPALPGGAVVFG